MILNRLAIIAICISTIIACKQSPAEEVMGYKYEKFTDTGDRKPQVGEYVYFKLVIADQKDSILQEMTREPQLPVIRISTEEEQKLNPNPISELLKIMSLGDSAKLIMPIDSFEQFPMDKSLFEEIHYNVVIDKIMSEEEHQEYTGKLQEEQLNEWAANKERLPVVESEVQVLIDKYNQGNLDMLKDESGIEYFMIEDGTGLLPVNNKMVSVQYYGVLKDGTMFDTSFRQGRPYTFTIGRREVIQGWDLGIPLVKEGGRALLYIPYTLAYGETGSPPNIGPKTDLFFYVEVEKVF